jgi:hypothetical protein
MNNGSFKAWGDQVKFWHDKMSAAFRKSVDDGSSYEFGSFDAGYTAGVQDASAPDDADDASFELGNLLSRIHGDHGQYVQKHGWKKAASDAMAKLNDTGSALPDGGKR